MHTFAVVSARPGRRVPAHVVDVLADGSPRDLTFAPDDHLHWTSSDGGLHVSGWSAGARHLSIWSCWHRTDRGDLVAFAGHPWPRTWTWDRRGSWAEQLADHIDIDTVDDRIGDYDGVFSMVVATADGSAAVGADPMGIGLVYHGSSDDVSVVSNRAAVVARLIAPAGREPARDVEGAVLLSYASNLQHRRTMFRGVELQTHATVTHLRSGHDLVHRQLSEHPWHDPDLVGVDPRDLYPAAIDDLRRLVEAQTTVPAWRRTVELTGGRDSRLVLALLLADDPPERMVCTTWGGRSLPDVQIAGQLADRFDLDLVAEGRPPPRPRKKQAPPRSRPAPGGPTPAARGAAAKAAAERLGGKRPTAKAAAKARPTRREPPRLGYEDRLRRHVWLTSGAQTVWNLVTNEREPSPNVSLSGGLGELLRDKHAEVRGVRTDEDLADYVRLGAIGFDAAGLLRRESRRRLDDAALETLRSEWPSARPASGALEAFYRTTRLRTWLGTTQELDNRNRLFPLLSITAVRVADALGAESRRQERLPFEAMLATRPELAEMPFAGPGWPESLVAGRPDADRYPTSPVPPPWTAADVQSRTAVRSAGAMSERAASLYASDDDVATETAARIPVLRHLADLGPDHPFYEQVDYDATMRAIGELPRLGFLARRQVHSVVTAAMWLGGAERPDDLT